MGGMVTAARNRTAQEKARASARAKNFQGVVLQRRTGFMVFPNIGFYFAQTQPAAA
jgi:hypothetical protein